MVVFTDISPQIPGNSGMSESLKLFQRTIASIELLTANELSSNEIHDSATRLQHKVKPCLDELQRSAAKLKELLEPCFEELAHAEAKWKVKPGIAAIPAREIQEHLGNLTGYLFKLQLLESQLVSQVVEQVKQSWQARVDVLKDNWFIDSKTGSNKSVNPSDKEKFIQSLRYEFYPQSIYLSTALSQALKPIQAQLQRIQIDKVAYYLNLLDTQEKSNYSSLLQALDLSTLNSKFEEPLSHLPNETQNFFETVNPLVERLIDQGFLTGKLPRKSGIKSLIGHGVLPFTYENFSQFAQEVQTSIEQIIKAVIKDGINQVAVLLKQSVQFYDLFLDKQQRYQQETLEQREFEQNWLLLRRQDLERVRIDIELALS